MGTKTFREFLSEKAQELSQRERRERREEWVAAVDRLMKQLDAWLVEADPAGVLEIATPLMEKGERGLGRYQVRRLDIRLGEARVQVLPVGRNVLGFINALAEESGVPAEGRVDITDGAEKYILYRQLEGGRESWHALDANYHSTPLDQARFEAIMQDLLS